jgi:hypothetical protein
MLERIITPIFGFAVFYGFIYFFCLLGFKRFPGTGWHTGSPMAGAAILAAVVFIVCIGLMAMGRWFMPSLFAAIWALFAFLAWFGKPKNSN